MFGQSTILHTCSLHTVRCTVYTQHMYDDVQREREKKSPAISSDTIWQNVRYKFHFKAKPEQKKKKNKKGGKVKEKQINNCIICMVYTVYCTPVHLLSTLATHERIENVYISISKRSKPILRNCI